MKRRGRRWIAAIVPAASVCFGILDVQAQGPPEVPSPNPGTTAVIPLQVTGAGGANAANPAKIASPSPWSKPNAAAGALPPLPMPQGVPSPQAGVIQPSRQSPDFVSLGGNRALVRLRNPFEGDLPMGPAILGGKSTPQYPMPAPAAPRSGAAPGTMAGGETPGTGAAPGQPTPPTAGMPEAGGATPSGAAAAAGTDAFGTGAGAGAAEAAGPTFGGTLASAGGLFPMIGDQSAIRFNTNPLVSSSAVAPPRPPRPPSPRSSSAFYPSARSFKISENMSPRPQDRVFYNFNYYDNLNATVNSAQQVPVTNIKAYRSIWGFEKTFNEGKGSLGLRLPLNTVTANSPGNQYSTPTTTALGDLTVFGKYILEENKQTGSLISIGLAITPPTGPQRFAGSPYLYGLNTLYIQPFMGWIWNSGRFYAQGFSAFDFPATTNDVSMMYNDVGIGYFLVRSEDPNAFLSSMAPVFEVHVNTPLNHRDPFNRFDIAGTPDAVNLTYGLNFGIRRTAVLTTALITPVASPKPFDLEWSLLLNIYFGRTRANPLAQIPPVVQ